MPDSTSSTDAPLTSLASTIINHFTSTTNEPPIEDGGDAYASLAPEIKQSCMELVYYYNKVTGYLVANATAPNGDHCSYPFEVPQTAASSSDEQNSGVGAEIVVPLVLLAFGLGYGVSWYFHGRSSRSATTDATEQVANELSMLSQMNDFGNGFNNIAETSFITQQGIEYLDPHSSITQPPASAHGAANAYAYTDDGTTDETLWSVLNPAFFMPSTDSDSERGTPHNTARAASVETFSMHQQRALEADSRFSFNHW